MKKKSKKHIKKSLKFVLTTVLIICLVITGIPMSFASTVTVKSVEINDIELIEGFNRDSDGFYYYSPEYTVTFSNGDILESDEYGEIYYNDEWYSIYYSDDQSEDNLWGVGTHKVEAEIMGYTTSFNVNIVESPVKSLSVDNIELYEYSGGGYCYDYDKSNSWYEYYYQSEAEFTVLLKDGTVLESEYGEITYNGDTYSLNCNDDQGYNNQWQIGTHKISASILGADTEFNVTILPSPIKSIRAKDIEIYENSCCDKAYYYDEDDNEIVWNKYYYSNYIEYTITMNDGSIYECDDSYFYYNDDFFYIDITDDQNADNEWGVGVHKSTASLFGKNAEFSVNIIPSLIKSIDVKPAEVIKKTNGEYVTVYNDDKAYKVFDYDFDSIFYEYSVTLNDGTIINSDYDGEILLNNKYYYLSFENYLDNSFDVGTYSIDASLLGVSTRCELTITDTPIKSIEYNPNINLIKNIDGYYSYDDSCFKYYYSLYEYTVTLKDGTKIESDDGFLEYEDYGEYPIYFDDQSYYNQWEVGSHVATATILGYDCELNIEVIESPVKSIKINELQLIKDACGYYTTDEDVYGESTSPEYFYYDYIITDYTVTLNDGTVLESDCDGDIYYNDNYYSIYYEDDQSYDNQWGLGKHKGTASIMGAEASYVVRVIESNVKSVKFNDVYRVENTGYEFYDEESDSYYTAYPFYFMGIISFTVTLNDGTVIESDYNGEVEYKGQLYSINNIIDDQGPDNEWGLGTHKATAYVMGKTATINVHIIESPVEKVLIDDITLNKSDCDDGYYYYYADYTVILKDGTKLEPYFSGVIDYMDQLYWPQFNDDQSEDNKWGIGTHTATANILGKETTFNVTIVDDGSDIEPDQGIYGDVNGDGEISIIDVTEIQKYIVSITNLTNQQYTLADVNGDGDVDIIDATLIQKYIVGLSGTELTGTII